MQEKRSVISVLIFMLLITLCMAGCGCNHAYSMPCDPSCDRCGEIREIGDKHEYDSDSMCKNITCTNCGYEKEQEHMYEVVHVTPSTFLDSGVETLACSKCTHRKKIPLAPLTASEIGMPAVYLTEIPDAKTALEDLKKSSGEIPISFAYESISEDIESFEGMALIKVQGDSSTQFAKKNYTVKLYQDDTFTKDKKLKVDFGWGKENKYCLKANYMDFSHARNIVNANLFAKVVAARDNPDPSLLKAPNNGVIDGFPILVYLNDEFHGLYTLNIPKDEWMMAMEGDETTKEAILMAEDWTSSTSLKEKIGSGAFEDYGWELEYASTENTDTQWVKDSFNALIELLNCGDNERIRRQLHEHLDIEAAIDQYLFTFFIKGVDLHAKNILWATFDGKVWIPSMYDMDMTYGISWDGSPIDYNWFPYIREDGSLRIKGSIITFEILTQCFPDEIEARWAFLRKDILTLENIKAHFDAFFAKIPKEVYEADRAKWRDEDSWPHTFTYDHHTKYYEVAKDQIENLDAFFYHFNQN